MAHEVVNGLEMYYEIHGEGPPLVVISGLGGDLTQYARVVVPLRKYFRVIAFDNRGSGRSDKPDMPYSMDMMADDTVGLMDALGLDHATIVGHSMGGRIALSLALNHPERVDHLVLVSTGPHRFDQLGVSLPMRLIAPLRKLALLRRKFPQPHYAFVRQRDATFDFDVADRLTEIRLPTLIMHGLRDRTALYSNALIMHGAIKDSRLVTFQGGHLFFALAERRRFLRELRRFTTDSANV